MIGLPSFAGEFCADQDNADGAASDLETNAGWSSSEESDDSESAAAGGTPSRQKQPPLAEALLLVLPIRSHLVVVDLPEPTVHDGRGAAIPHHT